MLNVCLSLNENNCQTALWFWTQHNPHGGGLVWLLDQVTWNLPDLSRVRKANGSLQSAVPAALHVVQAICSSILFPKWRVDRGSDLAVQKVVSISILNALTGSAGDGGLLSMNDRQGA